MLSFMLTFAQATSEGRAKGQASNSALSKRSKVAQCLEMQEKLKEDIFDPSTSKSQRALLIKAWDTLEERIRVLKGLPLPGSRKPEPERRRVGKAGSMLALAGQAGQADRYPAHEPAYHVVHDGQGGQASQGSVVQQA
jgi:hypothetical protein